MTGNAIISALELQMVDCATVASLAMGAVFVTSMALDSNALCDQILICVRLAKKMTAMTM